MRIGWLFLCLALTVLQGQHITRRLVREQLLVEAKADITRLVRVTLQLFQDGRPPKAEQFWKDIGRTDPMFDPWGNAYVLESPRAGLFLWRSAGPDGGYETPDDIVSRIPFGEGVNLDLTRPDLEPRTKPVDSAL